MSRNVIAVTCGIAALVFFALAASGSEEGEEETHRPAVHWLEGWTDIIPTARLVSLRVESRGAEAQRREPQPVTAKPIVPTSPQRKPAPEATTEANGAKDAGGIGTLSVNSTPAGAAVFLDGANVGQTPIEIDVPSGGHTVRLLHPSEGTEKRESVTVSSGRTSQINVSF